jgi:hypothetical protein
VVSHGAVSNPGEVNHEGCQVRPADLNNGFVVAIEIVAKAGKKTLPDTRLKWRLSRPWQNLE